jgi:hypothetical protein
MPEKESHLRAARWAAGEQALAAAVKKALQAALQAVPDKGRASAALKNQSLARSIVKAFREEVDRSTFDVTGRIAGLTGHLVSGEKRASPPSDDALIREILGVAKRRAELTPYLEDLNSYVRGLLVTERNLEQLSRPSPLREHLDQTAIVAEAMRAVRSEKMLTATEVSNLRGSRSTTNPRQYAARLRREGDLLALPIRKNSFEYPAFQFDRRGQIFPVARKVNALLGAASDPWGVASWWVSPHGALPHSASPRTLLGKQDEMLMAIAKAEVGRD